MTDDTRKPVSELSGRELDAAVAEEVVGETKPPLPTGSRGLEQEAITNAVNPGLRHRGSSGAWVLTTTGYEAGDDPVWRPKPYSTDITVAWEVWDNCDAIKNGFLKRCDTGQFGKNFAGARQQWWEFIFSENVERWRWRHPSNLVKADTAPEAICRAALRAVREGVGDG